MGRIDDARDLLSACEDQLADIRKEYEGSLRQQTISATLKIQIKNFFENLRSVLDYLAVEVLEKHYDMTGKRVYFPITRDRASFDGVIRQDFPDLEQKNKEIWGFLELLQPYNPKTRNWLSAFNKVNNENKHSSLVPQKKFERVEVEVARKGGRARWSPQNVRFAPCTSVLGAPIDVHTQLPVPSAEIAVRRLVWVDFRFDGVDESAVSLMQNSLVGVHAIYEGLRKLI